MREQITGDFLPLGSVLKLKDTENDELLYLVVARAVAKRKTDEIVPRYRVAPHPYGDVPSQEVFPIETEQIVEVLFTGYADQADEDFLAQLLLQMAKGEKAGSATAKTNQPEVEVQTEPSAQTDTGTQTESALDEEAKLKEDPFYKFRKGVRDNE